MSLNFCHVLRSGTKSVETTLIAIGQKSAKMLLTYRTFYFAAEVKRTRQGGKNK
jgi:hypothetical protein